MTAINWDEPPLKRWLDSITKHNTKRNYRLGYKAYHEYTGKTATELIQEVEADRQKPRLEQQDIVKIRLLGFYNWVLNERVDQRKGKKGLSESTATSWTGAIRSFYSTFGISTRLRGRLKLPKPRVVTRRANITVDILSQLVSHARTPRDRAIILTAFQGGIDTQTLTELNYGDVRHGLSINEYPLKLDVFRGKSGTEYYTFLGRDAINAIRTYIDDARSRGIEFTDKTPLFVKYRRSKGGMMEPEAVQKMIRVVSISAGLVGDLNHNLNPYGIHALRESFGSIMLNKGIPDTIVDFWLGHSIGEMANAYKSRQEDDLRRMYKEREVFLSIHAPNSVIEERLKTELEESFRATKDELQTLVTRLSQDAFEMKDRIRRLEHDNRIILRDNHTLKDRLDKIERLTTMSIDELRKEIVTS